MWDAEGASELGRQGEVGGESRTDRSEGGPPASALGEVAPALLRRLPRPVPASADGDLGVPHPHLVSLLPSRSPVASPSAFLPGAQAPPHPTLRLLWGCP